MRDLKTLSGPKQYIETVEQALKLVRVKYPNAMKEGSTNAWSFHAGEELVAEMWGHRTKPGWWLRIKEI